MSEATEVQEHSTSREQGAVQLSPLHRYMVNCGQLTFLLIAAI